VKMMDKENEIWRPWVSPSSSFTKSPLPTPQRRVQPIQPRRLSQLEAPHLAPHPSRRFAKPLTREQARQQTQPYIPKRMQQCNTWALGVFKSWADSRNQETPVDAPKCATDLLQAQHPLAKVDLWLALFVLEVRRVDGEYYPPSTLQNILTALFRVYKGNLGAGVPSFMNSITPDITMAWIGNCVRSAH
jgi:hypothetical protein